MKSEAENEPNSIKKKPTRLVSGIDPTPINFLHCTFVITDFNSFIHVPNCSSAVKTSSNLVGHDTCYASAVSYVSSIVLRILLLAAFISFLRSKFRPSSWFGNLTLAAFLYGLPC